MHNKSGYITASYDIRHQIFVILFPEKILPMRYFLKLSYKGTNYHGWQLQKNANTVQAEVENALSVLAGVPVKTTGAGRTDTGVHARVFFAHFDSAVGFEGEAKDKMIYRMNSILPRDIVIHDLLQVHSNANARFDAISRSYHYYISTKKNPFYEGQVYYFYNLPDLELMNEGARIIESTSDFTSFSKTGSSSKTNHCKVFEAKWETSGDLIIFRIKADRFLRNMVRAIAGTLIEAGLNKFPLDHIYDIVKSKNRSNAGYSLPAEGLFLEQIEYPPEIFI